MSEQELKKRLCAFLGSKYVVNVDCDPLKRMAESIFDFFESEGVLDWAVIDPQERDDRPGINDSGLRDTSVGQRKKSRTAAGGPSSRR